jgi:hypothetical protein
VVLDQQRREVFHVQVADDVGVILDVDPDEELVRMARRHLVERRAVGFAGAAPGGAQAGDDPALAFKGGGHFFAVGGIQGQTVLGGIG